MNAARESRALALAGLALAACYVVLHPYRGIAGDALIYVTHEWAGRPGGALAADMLLAHDRQTALTLFSPFIRVFLALAPVALAAKAAATLAILLWCGGVAALVLQLARVAGLSRRAALAMAALIAVAPLGYSASPAFSAGEYLAIPRPFAEAFALACVAALIGGRRVAAAGFGLVSALFHPLVGATCLAMLALTPLVARPRLMLLAAAGATIVWLIAAGVLPRFDAEWRALLEGRAYYLFLAQSPPTFWADLVWRVALVAMAARVATGDARRFLIALLVACGVALLLSAIADLSGAILLIEAQPWRMTWLLAVVAPACAIIVALRGGSSLTLACLACAFTWRESLLVCVAFSAAAHALASRERAAPAYLARLFWLFAVTGWALFVALPLAHLAQAVVNAPPDYDFDAHLLWGVSPFAAPLALALHIWRDGRLRLGAPLLALGIALLFPLHDGRSHFDRAVESQDAPQALRALRLATDASVLWIGGGKETWFWLDRVNWGAGIQGSSVVFSRDLAQIWSDRAKALVGLALEPPSFIDHRLPRTAAPAPTSESLRAICARADAPALIVTSLADGEMAPAGAGVVDAPASFTLDPVGERLVIRRRSSLALYDCAAERP